MNRDQLYLIRPDFPDHGGKTFFCPGCAQMTGLLNYYPALNHLLEVHLVDFPRPRPALVALLGAEHQSCPVLVLKANPGNLPADVPVAEANGRHFIVGANEIATYLAHVHSTGFPH